MSEVKVNKLSPRSGTTVTIGDSGDTINIVGTLQNNGAAIPGDISSVVAGTGLSGGGTSGDVTINIEAAQPTITSLGTITTFRSTGIDDNADALAMTINSSENVGIGETSPLGKLHVKSGDSGVSSPDITDLVVECSGSGGMSLLGATDGQVEIAFGDSGDANIGRIAYNNNGNYLATVVNASEATRIHSNGVLSASAGIALGVGTANTASNVLNDYEEGTFTPIYRCTGNQLSSVTYNAWTGGRYTKVGQLVSVTAAIASNAVTLGSPSGNLRIGGLPFTVAAVTGSTLNTRGAVVMSNQNLWATNHTPNNGNVVNGTTEFDLAILYGNNDDVSSLASTDILTGSNTGGNRLFFTVTYMTDA